MCVQCILFVRIFAVYPPRTTSRLLALAIYGTLFAMTVARIVNITIALKRISDAGRLAPDAWTITVVGRRIPSVMAELAMGLVYDTYEISLHAFSVDLIADFVQQHRFISVSLPSPPGRRTQS